MATKPRPTLSLIILAYNEAAYIGRCLDSIAAQTVAPDEVIVVDNNSTDTTAAIATRYPFVTLVRETTQGIAPARDAGFNAASGQLLGRIDADCELPPTWVNTAHTLFDSHVSEICGIAGPGYFYAIHNKLLRAVVRNVLSTFGFFAISRLLLGHETLYGSNMVITRAAWDKVKDEVCQDSSVVHEDIDIGLHIGLYGQILFDQRLQAGISARPLAEKPAKTVWRIKAWIKTVTRHRRLFVGSGNHQSSARQ